MKIVCPHCGITADKSASAVGRARRDGSNIYCSRLCNGLARRAWKSEAQKVEEKRLYDAEYRRKNLDRLTVQKAERHLRTYDPKKAAIERKKRMPLHIEYCRQPEYKKYKQQYDRQYRAQEFGEYAESYLLVQDINREILQRTTRYDISIQNGTLNKSTRRKREYARTVGCESQKRAVGNPERDQVGHDASRSR